MFLLYLTARATRRAIDAGTLIFHEPVETIGWGTYELGVKRCIQSNIAISHSLPRMMKVTLIENSNQKWQRGQPGCRDKIVSKVLKQEMYTTLY